MNQMVIKAVEVLIKVVSLPSVFHILIHNLMMHAIPLISVGSFKVEKVRVVNIYKTETQIWKPNKICILTGEKCREEVS